MTTVQFCFCPPIAKSDSTFRNDNPNIATLYIMNKSIFQQVGK